MREGLQGIECWPDLDEDEIVAFIRDDDEVIELFRGYRSEYFEWMSKNPLVRSIVALSQSDFQGFKEFCGRPVN